MSEEASPEVRREPRAVPRAASGTKPPSAGTAKTVAIAVVVLIVGLFLGSSYRARKDNPIVMSVNNANINMLQFYHRCELADGKQVLRQMVNDELVLELADKMGVAPTEQQIDAEYETAKKQPNFAQQLAASGQTENDVKQLIKIRVARTNVVTKGISVSDAEIQDYYSRNINHRNPNALFWHPEAIQIAVIVAGSQAVIQQALTELHAGSSFASVAAKYSRDGSAKNGGLLPAIPRGHINANLKVPGLEEKIFALDVGRQIDNLKINNMYWIIRCVGKKPDETVPFEKVKDQCRQGALFEKGAKVNAPEFNKEATDLQSKSVITAFWPQYKDAVVLKPH